MKPSEKLLAIRDKRAKAVLNANRNPDDEEAVAKMTIAHLEYDATMFAALLTVIQFMETETSNKSEVEWN